MESHRSGSADLVPTHIIRTETVISKLPIHQLAKRGGVEIAITEHNADGETTLRWEVSYNSRYGQPQQLAYKLDTLVVNRCIDTIGHPLSKVIRLGSLRGICLALGLTISGRATTDVKHALHQNAGAYITAYLHYKGRDGTERSVETGFTRYSVIFTGQHLPNGIQADAVHLVLNDPYWEILNHAPVRPLDYQYLTTLTPAAQRFYELLSYKIFAALKYGHEQATMRYSAYCAFAPQQRYLTYSAVKKQMHKVHKSHLESGYLANVSPESLFDDEGRPDWMLHYMPGPKAHAEYQAFNHQKHRGRQLKQVPEQIEQTTASIAASPDLPPFKPLPRDDATTQAMTLVREFHERVHGVTSYTPQATEVKRATELMTEHGIEFAIFFVNYACKAVRRGKFKPRVFGGLLSYKAEALSANEREQRQQEQRRIDQAESLKLKLKPEYDQVCAESVMAYLKGLGPDVRESLERTVRKQLQTENQGVFVNSSLFNAWVQAEIRERLAEAAGVLSFEAWLARRET